MSAANDGHDPPMSSPGAAANLLASTLPAPGRQSPAMMAAMAESAPPALLAPDSPAAAAVLLGASAQDGAPSPASAALGGGTAAAAAFGDGGGGAAASASASGGLAVGLAAPPRKASGFGFGGGGGAKSGAKSGGLNPFGFVSTSILAAKRLQRRAAATQLTRTKGGHSHVVQRGQRRATTDALSLELHSAMHPYVPPPPREEVGPAHRHAHDTPEAAAARAEAAAAERAEAQAAYEEALAAAAPPFKAVDGANVTTVEKLAAAYASGGRREEAESLWAAAVAVREALHRQLLQGAAAALRGGGVVAGGGGGGGGGGSGADGEEEVEGLAMMTDKQREKAMLKAEAAECRLAMALLALARVRRQTDDAAGAQAAYEQAIAMAPTAALPPTVPAAPAPVAVKKKRRGAAGAAAAAAAAAAAPKPTALQASMARTLGSARHELSSLLRAHAVQTPEEARAEAAARCAASRRAGDGAWHHEKLVERLTRTTRTPPPRQSLVRSPRSGGSGSSPRRRPAGSPAAGGVYAYAPPKAVSAMRAELQQILFPGGV